MAEFQDTVQGIIVTLKANSTTIPTLPFEGFLFLGYMGTHGSTGHFQHNEAKTEWPSLCRKHSLINGLVLDCSNSSVLAMELLQSCTKP